MCVRSSSVVGSVLWASTAALAGAVSFDPPQATWTGEPISFDVSVSETSLAAFDTVSVIFTFPEAVDVQFSYAQTFLDSVTLPPYIGPFCRPGHCHLMTGGNRFVTPLWSAPLLFGTLTVDVSGIESSAFPVEILTSASAETQLLGWPLSLVADPDPLMAAESWTDWLEGGVTISSNPEPATLVMLILGSIGVMRPARRFRW